jgi:hypothetical protein
MKTIRTKVYSFNELNKDAKQKAIENNCEINIFSDWWDSIYEDAKNVDLKITSFDLDRNRHCKGEFYNSAISTAEKIINEHGKSCETFKTATNFIAEWQPIFNSYMDETNEDTYENSDLEDRLIELETDFLHELLEDYSIILEKEYEYLTSSEAIIETILANEYDFLPNGNRF